MKAFVRVGACALAAAIGSAAPAPHVHGASQLDVAVEAGRITLRLAAPLDALLGFERAPRTAGERALVDATVARLKAADALFAIDPAAGCRLARVELESAALKLGDAPARPAADGHADLDASFEYDCSDAAKASYIEVGLFDAFARMRRVEVQAVMPKRQFKRTLERPAKRLSLAR